MLRTCASVAHHVRMGSRKLPEPNPRCPIPSVDPKKNFPYFFNSSAVIVACVVKNGVKNGIIRDFAYQI